MSTVVVEEPPRVHKIRDESGIRCGNCGDSVRGDAATCPHCSSEFVPKTSRSILLKHAAGLVLFVLGIVGLLFGPLTLVTAPFAVISQGLGLALRNLAIGLIGTGMMVGGIGGFLRMDLEPVYVEDIR